jgi:putative transposase
MIGAVREFLTLSGHLVGMSQYLRPRRPGATVFFTVALGDRASDLLVREIETLRKAVQSTRSERPFGIDAWVVLPDHMHCVWTLPEGDADYSTRMGAIKARFAMGLPPGRLRPSHIVRREKGIWQRRFWEHHIRNMEEFRAAVRYCWINPVKHGLTERPEAWPHSSYHRDADQTTDLVL